MSRRRWHFEWHERAELGWGAIFIAALAIVCATEIVTKCCGSRDVTFVERRSVVEVRP